MRKETILNYYSFGDTWVVLAAEQTYLGSLFGEIGKKSVQDQLFMISENLERQISEERKTNLLMSAFYLLFTFEKEQPIPLSSRSMVLEDGEKEAEGQNQESREGKIIKFQVLDQYLQYLSSPFLIREIIRWIKSHQNFEEKNDSSDDQSELKRMQFKAGFDLLLIIIWDSFKNNSNLMKINSKKNSLFFEVFDFVIQQIEFSRKNAHILMKRTSKLMCILLSNFQKLSNIEINSQELSSNIELDEQKKIEIYKNFQKMLDEQIQTSDLTSSQIEPKNQLNHLKLLQDSSSKNIEILNCHLLKNKSSPLSEFVVVGLLRAMLKLYSLESTSKNSSKKKKSSNQCKPFLI